MIEDEKLPGEGVVSSESAVSSDSVGEGARLCSMSSRLSPLSVLDKQYCQPKNTVKYVQTNHL